MSFIADAVKLLQTLSRGLSDHRDDEAVDLAAHLFAIASRIPRECGSAPLSELPEGLPRVDTVPRVLEAIRALPPTVDARSLYWTLVGGLQAFDRDWSTATLGREALRSSTPLHSHGDCDLSGEVVHWLRPRSALSALRSSRRGLAAAGGPPRRAPHPADNLERLGMFWNVHQCWPRIAVRDLADLLVPLVLESGPAAGREEFRIALCPLLAQAYPGFCVTADGKFFRAAGPDSLQGRQALHEHLDLIHSSAREKGVHLLVMPELQVDQVTRAHLADLLRTPMGKDGPPGPRLPFGIVAGSFHVWRNSEDVATDPPVNESVLYDEAGRVLLRHQKRGRFRVTRGELAAAAKALPGMFAEAPHGADGDEVVEGIVHGPDLEIIETSLGRLAVAICADCIAADQTCLESVFRDLRPDLLVIVSMTPETDLFAGLLERFARVGIGCLFVNARCICTANGGQLLAAADLALYEPGGAPPTRVRWCIGEDGKEQPEVRYYQPTDNRGKEWRPLHDAVAGTDPGIAWLGGSDTRLGLVVSLGPHFAWKPTGA